MLIVSQSLVATLDPDFPPWSPVIGWHNLVTAGNVSAGTEEADYPVTNLATIITAERWQATNTAEQRLVVTPDYIGPIDYIALAGHNLGTARVPYSVEGYTELDENGNPVWFELVQEVMLEDDAALIARFTPQALAGICFKFGIGTAPVRASILYVGKLLVVPPHIQPDFTPLPYGRVVEFVSDESDQGEFLGNMVLGVTLESSVSLPYLDPDWYIEEMDPFIKASPTTPFFFSWDPLNRPRESAFAQIKPGSNPQPRIHTITGQMSIELQMKGLSP